MLAQQPKRKIESQEENIRNSADFSFNAMTPRRNPFLFYLSLILLTVILTFGVNLPDFDLWARLAVGSIFFQTGSILKHDIFSYLPTKELWIDHEWGSGVVFYCFAKFFGDGGIFFLKGTVVFALLILVLKIIRLQSDRDPGVLFFGFLVFSLFPGLGSLVRCQIFSYLFFTLWLYGLEKIKNGNHQIIWMFPASMLMWVNLHGGFLIGVGLVIIYLLGELLNRRNASVYFFILLAILPVSLINPYGIKLWPFIVNAATMPRPYIYEWTSISLAGPYYVFGGLKIHALVGFFILAALVLSVGMKVLREKEKPDWTRILLVAILFYFSVRHQRHAMFFILAVSGLFYHRFIELFAPLRKFLENFSARLKIYPAAEKFTRGLPYFLLIIVLFYQWPYFSRTIIVDRFVYPVGSFECIRINHLSGNLATIYNWGSYALWKLYPQCRVMIDGRYEEVYPQNIYLMAMQLSEHTVNWRDILIKYPADILVLPKDRYAPADMTALSDWQIVYTDFASVVLLPKARVSERYIYPTIMSLFNFKEDLSKTIVFRKTM